MNNDSGGFSADVDCLNLAAVFGQQFQLLGLRVRHDDAHERLAGNSVPRVHRDRRERDARAAVHVFAKLPVDVRKLLPELNAPLSEVQLNVDEAHPSRSVHVPAVVSGQRCQNQRVRSLNGGGRHVDGRIAATAVTRGVFIAIGRFGSDGGSHGPQIFVQVTLDALVHHVPFPLYRSRTGHLTLHAHRYVQHEPRVRVVRLAQLFQCVQFRIDVRPLGVHRLALHVVVPAAPHELVGQFDAREMALDSATAVRQVTAPRDRGQPLDASVVGFDGVRDRRAQCGRSPVQARFPMVLPVSSPATSRTVHVITVVAHLERTPGLGNGGRTLAFRVPAADRPGPISARKQSRRRRRRHTAAIHTVVGGQLLFL